MAVAVHDNDAACERPSSSFVSPNEQGCLFAEHARRIRIQFNKYSSGDMARSRSRNARVNDGRNIKSI
jgi:hypothetical protein